MEHKLRETLRIAGMATDTIRELREERDALHAELQAAKQEIANLKQQQAMGSTLQLSEQLGSLELGENKAELKAEIDRLLQEIDDCLKLLSD